jgi:hypothetical protein
MNAKSVKRVDWPKLCRLNPVNANENKPLIAHGLPNALMLLEPFSPLFDSNVLGQNSN